MPYVTRIDCFEPDYEACPIPPAHIEREPGVCKHTPTPDGYNEWHEWARKASKTHAQVRCPCCGLWKVWLPKAMARAINKREEREMREFSEACMANIKKYGTMFPDVHVKEVSK